MDSKPFWQSKTLWANVIAFGVSALNGAVGWLQVSPEENAAAIVLINLVMRAVTKGAVTLS